jgi:beta-lactamase class A
MMNFSRRHLLIGSGLFAALMACGKPTSSPRLSDPAEPLPPAEERIAALEKRHNAFVGLYGADLVSGRTLAHRDEDLFAMCSTFKAYLAARVLQKVQRDELALSDQRVIEPASVVGYSPVTGPKAGTSLSLADLCQAALQQSDNTAANALLAVIGGPPAITEFARSFGDDRTRLDRWETELNSALPGDLRDTSTPRALGDGFRKLLTGTTVLDEERRSALELWMRGNLTSARSIRAGLPPGWTSADKTGTGDYASTNDIGVVFGPDGQKLLLAVMTRTQSSNPNAEALQPLIAEVTKLALPVLLGQG